MHTVGSLKPKVYSINKYNRYENPVKYIKLEATAPEILF